MRIRACSASTATVIARLIHDPINGDRSTLHSHEVTVTTAAPATPAPPVLSAGAEAAFVGETVTLTASAQSPGSVAHYQWQQWSAGSWTDLGATTPIATRDVTSNAAAVNFYRVLVVYDFGTTLESQPVAVEWKAMTVTVASSPDFPRSGPAAASTVTLTAGGDVPPTVSYQWQEDTGSGWTDLGATTTSVTKEVTSATRGTRKFRVEVRNAGVASAESEPVYVTWDEWDIVADMIGELSEGVASSSDYLRDQSALMGCMRATSTSPGSGGGRSVPTPPLAVTIATFDDLLASYTGDVKARMEDTGTGGCATQSNAMFSTNEREARAELARLKIGNAVYAGLLDTPHGRQFEANAGDVGITKLLTYMLAHEPPVQAEGPGRTSETPNTIQRAGFDCIPWSGREPSSVEDKIAVVNCLMFDTPHSFWVDSATEMLRRIDNAYQRPDGAVVGPLDWLGYGDWECTLWADGPLPTCYKHDVALSGLQKFAGMSSSTEEMDEAWNPRNKHLADAKARADIEKYDCQDSTLIAIISPLACLLPAGPVPLPMLHTAGVMHFGMNKINSLWPVTRHDVEHSERTPRFVECDIPKIVDVRTNNRNPSFDVSWTYSPGCISDISVDSYRFCWSFRAFRRDMGDCPEVDGNESSVTFMRLLASDVTLESVEIRPNEIMFRDFRYDIADFFLPGKGEVYYAKQFIGLKY